MREQLARLRVQMEYSETRKNKLLDFDDLDDQAIRKRIREAAAEVKRLKTECNNLESDIEKASSLQSSRKSLEDTLKRLAESRKTARLGDEYIFRTKIAHEIKSVIKMLRFTSSSVTEITNDNLEINLFYSIPKRQKK